MAFVGVPRYIHGGGSGGGLSSRGWEEGANAYDGYDDVPAGRLTGYRTVVVADSAFECDPAAGRMKRELRDLYLAGGRVVVLALEGCISTPSGILGPLFGCDWEFLSYTKETWCLTSGGAAALGGKEGEVAHSYAKANCLRVVPESEGLCRPNLTFHSVYGYEMGDEGDELYEEGDEEGWGETPRRADAPVALHGCGENGNGGEVVWLGFVNYGSQEQEAIRIAECVIRRGGQPAFPFERPPREASRGVRAVF